MAPAVRVAPSLDDKLALLGGAAAYDLSCACGDSGHRQRSDDGRWIYPAVLPSGRRVPILKVLQQAGCERACAYCVERQGGSRPARACAARLPAGGAGQGLSFTPEELAQVFLRLKAAGRVDGMFLSSVIRGGAVASMDRMLATAELLRRRRDFRGYLHLKILPGAQPAQVERAMQLATRVSINMESPDALHLARIAPGKSFDRHILEPMRQVARAQAEGRFRRAGQTTQFVVGAGDETDRDIVSAAAWLYDDLQLARVYYSGFQPVPDTPLADRPPAPFLREHRLYQTDFLLRRYGFSLEEIPFEVGGGLSLTVDPKTAWARAHPERFPVEVNTAERESLVRVPGIGPTSVARILEMRREGRLRAPEDLRRTGASWRVAAAWLLFDGRRGPVPARERQLDLWPSAETRPSA